MSKPSRDDPSQDPFVRFGDVAIGRLNQQCQYASRFVDGRHGYPNLGDGLRFRGRTTDYHTLMIHRDDVETFVDRVAAWRNTGDNDSDA